MAPAIGMQMNLVLLGLSSGLQLGQRRYARKVNPSAGMGAGRGQFLSYISFQTGPEPRSPLKYKLLIQAQLTCWRYLTDKCPMFTLSVFTSRLICIWV